MTLEGLLESLGGSQLYVEDVLDALWLAQLGRVLSVHPAAPGDAAFRAPVEPERPVPAAAETAPVPSSDAGGEIAQALEIPPTERAPVYAPGDISPGDRTVKASPVVLPAGRALPDRLGMARALRPFRKRWPSARDAELDEDATADATADLGGYFYPVVRPVQERWFDVDVVLEDDAAIAFWEDTMRDYCRMLRETGAFRDVRAWNLRLPDAPVDSPKWRPRVEAHTGVSMSTQFLGGAGVRRLIIFATHGSSPRWTDGSYARVIEPWLPTCSVVLLQLRPRHRWKRTALGEPDGVCRAHEPGAPSSRLRIDPFWWKLAADETTGGRGWLPVVELQARALADWSAMQMARGSRSSAILLKGEAATPGETTNSSEAPRDFVQLAASLRESSPQAFRLAVALCSSAFTIPVARLVQEARFGTSADQADLGEVLLSGLVFARSAKVASPDASTAYYDFYPEAREILLRSLRGSDAEQIAGALQQRMSQYIERIYGRPITFRALVPDENGDYDLPAWAQPFAEVGVSLLGISARGRTPHELIERFRSAQPAPVIAAAARLASDTFTGHLDRDRIAPDLWTAILAASLVQQMSTGEWRFLPGIAPLLARIASDVAAVPVPVQPRNDDAPAEPLQKVDAPNAPQPETVPRADEAFPTLEVVFDEHGSIAGRLMPNAIVAQMKERAVTDLFLFVHGWNVDRAEARYLFHELVASIQLARVAQPPPRSRPAALFVYWPSKALANEEEEVESDESNEPRQSAGWFESVTEGAKAPLRVLSFWQMRGRAGTVGRSGLGPLVGGLATEAPEVRMHLIAHSLGARVVAHALIALAESTPLFATSLGSVTLLQAVLSHHIFAPSMPSNPDQRGVLADAARVVDGPILVTYSQHDTVARTFYPTAVLAAGDDDAPGERTSERGALGRDGAQRAAAIAAQLGPPGSAYTFQPGRIYNVDASEVIRAHIDVAAPEIAWLILSAAGIAPGGPA